MKQRSAKKIRKWKEKFERERELRQEIRAAAPDILRSKNFRSTRSHVQHGNMTVNDHSMNVAKCSLAISEKLHIPCEKKELIRGALLHDYFLYDWHEKDDSHRWHGFSHARVALKNAKKDFQLGEIEQDVIRKHMFPLNLKPPKYKESALVCLADKLSALEETIRRR